MRRVRRRDEVARLAAEIEEARPYLPLAREIHDEVHRALENGAADADTLADAVEAVPERERRAVALAVFHQLPAEQQWEILERAFAGDELRAALAGERALLLERHERRTRLAELAGPNGGALDTSALRDGARLVLGLFRERDVRDAIPLGPKSTACARRLVLQLAGTDGALRVIEDVFNPSGGYYVTEEYDVDNWSAERLPAHAIVRVGAITAEGGRSSFSPVLHLGARVDVECGGTPAAGRLHLGYAMVEDVDVFAKGEGV